LLPLFATGVIDIGGKFAVGVGYRWRIATGVIDTGGKFAAGVFETGEKLAANVVDTGDAPWLANTVSPRIFENIWNDPNAIIRGLGEDDSRKNQKQNILWHCPFKQY
jgi:hypothetical protein